MNENKWHTLDWMIQWSGVFPSQTDRQKKRADGQKVAAFNLGVAEAQRRRKAAACGQSHVSLKHCWGSVCVSLSFWSCDACAFRARTSLRVDPVPQTVCRSRDASCRSWCGRPADADRRRRRHSRNNSDWTDCICCRCLKSESGSSSQHCVNLFDLRRCDWMCLFYVMFPSGWHWNDLSSFMRNTRWPRRTERHLKNKWVTFAYFPFVVCRGSESRWVSVIKNRP